MDLDAATARATRLLKRAERYRRRAQSATARDSARELARVAQELEAEAAIEMAHAALLRHYARDEDEAPALAEGPAAHRESES